VFDRTGTGRAQAVRDNRILLKQVEPSGNRTRTRTRSTEPVVVYEYAYEYVYDRGYLAYIGR
jgi:hypothetical protein